MTKPKTIQERLKRRIEKALKRYQAKTARPCKAEKPEARKRRMNGMDLLLLVMLLGWLVGAVLAQIL